MGQFGTYKIPTSNPVQLQYQYPVQYPEFNLFNNNISPVVAGLFDVPALFQPLECIVQEELTVTTDSLDSVGRTLTYSRDLTCECDTNGNPFHTFTIQKKLG